MEVTETAIPAASGSAARAPLTRQLWHDMSAVAQSASDPFFEQLSGRKYRLRAQIQEGLDEADHGELIDESDVWQHLYAVSDEIERYAQCL